jgi:hypothetical protein
LGVNLRSDPCWGATNLGFIPAGSDLIILGLPRDDYTPVRVNNDVLQIPFDNLIIATIKAEFAAPRFPSISETATSEAEPTFTPTPTSSATETPLPEPSPTVTPSVTNEPL